MKERILFRRGVDELLHTIDPDILAYDQSEFWMVQAPYESIRHYALERQLTNTCIALELALGLHDGTHRKSSVVREGISYRLPYAIHCLVVCRILINLQLPLSRENEDILLAAALCHDMIEDIPFPNNGTELAEVYHLDPRVYETVRLVSKRKDFTPEEERIFFHNIESNRLALLIKLSDRSHNVEDLYNMSVKKVHEYVGETRNYYLPMCRYGLEHYPELYKPIEILQDKILGLTGISEILVDRGEAREQKLLEQLEALRQENAALRQTYQALWNEEVAP